MNINSTFPETNGILILNWPDQDFNLRNHISLSSLKLPVQIYSSLNRELSSQPKTICIFVNTKIVRIKGLFLNHYFFGV